MAPSRRLGRLVVLCALAAAHEPTEHERLDTDYDYVVKTRSKGPRAADEDQTLLALTDSAYKTAGGVIIRASQWAAHHAEGAGVALFDEGVHDRAATISTTAGILRGACGDSLTCELVAEALGIPVREVVPGVQEYASWRSSSRSS